jgi:Phytanoyl-CoA dioxygenase (PhyH)
MSNNIEENFERDGYVIEKNVFSNEEIEQFRKLVYAQYEIDKAANLNFTPPNSRSKAKYVKGDLLSKKLLHPILLDDRVLKLARQVLNTDKLLYFGDSSYQIGTGQRGFHRDSIDRENLDGPDWKSRYTLIRLGIYLQNHKNYSGGLKIKPGTHNKKEGPSKFADNETGDLLAWSLKLLHSGNAVKLKFFPHLSIDNSSIENRIPTFLKKEEEKERISLFMTYAAPSEHVQRYIDEYELKREDTRATLQASTYTQEVLDLAQSKGIEVKILFPEKQLIPS